jgi:hypothetical protein
MPSLKKICLSVLSRLPTTPSPPPHTPLNSQTDIAAATYDLARGNSCGSDRLDTLNFKNTKYEIVEAEKEKGQVSNDSILNGPMSD